MKLLLSIIVWCALLSPPVRGQQASQQGQRAPAPAVPRSRLFNAEQLLRDVETLSADDMAGRKTGTPGGVKARDYVVRRFKESGLKFFASTPLQFFTFPEPGSSAEVRGANVVGYVKGKTSPERYLVVTAHYDHVGVNKGEIYNGADDNASGASALFALGKYFSKHRPQHSIIFVAFDNEEGGGNGARKFVSEPPVDARSIVLNVNLDMVSRSDRNELYAVGTYHYPFLKPYLERVGARATVKLLFGHDTPGLPAGQNWTFQSDHAAFHRAKIPFIYFGVEDHKDYHKPTDDFGNINQVFFVHAVETILETVKAFDASLPAIQQQRAVSP